MFQLFILSSITQNMLITPSAPMTARISVVMPDNKNKGPVEPHSEIQISRDTILDRLKNIDVIIV